MSDRRFLAVLVVFTLTAGVAMAAARELTVERGGSASIPASFATSFTIEFEGEFSGEKLERWTAKRFLYDGRNNESIDLFEPGRFRLGNTHIFFREAVKGKIRNPDGNKDHYAEVGSFEGRHTVRISYDRAGKRCRIWRDGDLEGDYRLEIRTAGKVGRLSFPGFEGKVRVLEGGGSGNLDEVVDPDQNPDAGSRRTALTASNPGTRKVTAAADGEVSVTAKLSTRGVAKLIVTITSDGKERRWLEWKREGDADPSPLQVDGKARADSMFEREPGDFSPQTVKEGTAVKKGDVVTFTLKGDFGDGTPLLRFAMPEAPR